MKNLFKTIEHSFTNATKGTENLNIVIWYWGIIAYLVAYFIINKAIHAIDIHFIEIAISVLTAIYFAWHIYAVKKCSPKKIKLSKEDKKRQKIENKHKRVKSMMRKLLLQEPITKWNSVKVTIVMDLLCIAIFLDKIF